MRNAFQCSVAAASVVVLMLGTSAFARGSGGASGHGAGHGMSSGHGVSSGHGGFSGHGGIGAAGAGRSFAAAYGRGGRSAVHSGRYGASGFAYVNGFGRSSRALRSRSWDSNSVYSSRSLGYGNRGGRGLYGGGGSIVGADGPSELAGNGYGEACSGPNVVDVREARREHLPIVIYGVAPPCSFGGSTGPGVYSLR